MEDIRAKALKEREALLEKLAEIDSFLAVYDRLSGSSQEPTYPAAETPGQAAPNPPKGPNRGRPAALAEAAEDVIRAAGEPLTRRQIVERIEARGIDIPSPDKPRYMGTILWRHKDRFVNLEGEGYWLRDQPNNRTGGPE